jgi:aspartate/tyrosine/aromatic aminotransferase
VFDQLPAHADDPILGLFEAYKADPRPHKVNLGIGIYCDEQGRVPVLASVRAARALLVEADAPSVYAPTEGGAAPTATRCGGWCSARWQRRRSWWCRPWPAPAHSRPVRTC